MKENIDLLQSFIASSLEAVKKTGDFVIQQAPDFIHQILTYNLIKYSVLMIILLASSIFLSLIMFHFYKKFIKNMKREDEEDGYHHNPIELSSSIFLIPTIIFIICAINYGLTVIQILVAPKIYLLEYAAELIK